MKKCIICGKLLKTQNVVCSAKCNGKYTGNLRRGKLGKKSVHWKGGMVKINNRWFKYAPEHPNACVNKTYVPYARWLMSKKLGRPIRKNEDVHHINGIKTDDRLENLVVLTKRLHGKLLKHTEETKQIIRGCTAKQRRLRGKFIPNNNSD